MAITPNILFVIDVVYLLSFQIKLHIYIHKSALPKRTTIIEETDSLVHLELLQDDLVFSGFVFLQKNLLIIFLCECYVFFLIPCFTSLLS